MKKNDTVTFPSFLVVCVSDIPEIISSFSSAYAFFCGCFLSAQDDWVLIFLSDSPLDRKYGS